MSKNQKDIELRKEKELADKRLLDAEVIIGTLSIFFLLALTAISSFVSMEEWLRIVLIIVGVIPFLVACPFMIEIEQTAGYYECAECKTRYIPTYKSVLWAPHMGRTRRMKCPHCGKKSWHKKRIEKE